MNRCIYCGTRTDGAQECEAQTRCILLDPTASAELLSAAMEARALAKLWQSQDSALREIFASVSSELDEPARMF